MTNTNSQGLDYESLVRTNFCFLESERGMGFSGVKEVGKGDPREAGLVASYRMDDLKVDIGWSEIQKSATVLVHIANEDIPRRARYVYLDSFVEFSSSGAEKSIVAQIYPRMSESGMLRAMRDREDLFEKTTLSNVLCLLAEKLRRHFDEVVYPSADMVLRYHDWMSAR